MSPKVLWKMGQTTRVGAVWGGDNDDEGGVKGEGWQMKRAFSGLSGRAPDA